jgi:hypothetical protein
VYACIVVLELVLVVAGWYGFGYWWRHGGPGTQWGMAARVEAAATLGVVNLRRRAGDIRPDLYQRRRR